MNPYFPPRQFTEEDLPSDADMLRWIEAHRATVEWSTPGDCWTIHIKTGEQSSVSFGGGDSLRSLLETALCTYP